MYALHPFCSVFPYELVEAIIQDVWEDSNSPLERSDFFYTCSLVSQQWRIIVLHISNRNLIIESPIDLHRTHKLRHRLERLCKSEHESHCYRAVRTRNIRLAVFREFSPRNWVAFFMDLSPLVQHCCSAQVRITDDWNHATSASWEALFQFLARMKALTSLTLVWTYTSQGICLPEVPLPAVTHLRVHHFPRYSISQPGQRGVRSFACHLLAQFPNLRTLSMDEPHFLKDLVPTPATLTDVVIEAPLCGRLPQHGPYSSLMGWNIPAAFNRGFLARIEDGPPRPATRIIVNAGETDPIGWIQAQTACARHGVMLERRCTYYRVPEPSSPPKSEDPETPSNTGLQLEPDHPDWAQSQFATEGGVYHNAAWTGEIQAPGIWRRVEPTGFDLDAYVDQWLLEDDAGNTDTDWAALDLEAEERTIPYVSSLMGALG